MRLNQGRHPSLAAFASLLLFSASALADDGGAGALVQKVVEAIPKVPFTAKLRLSSASFEARELAMSRKIVGDAHGSYLEVTAPSMLEGIRFLFLERPGGPNEQYIKVAASRTSVRVSAEVRRQPFLGSTFYVSDLVMPELDRFTYRFVGDTELLGRKCRLVEMTPKAPAEEVYPKTVLALDPADQIILRREFFDKDGKPFKVWTIDKVEKIEGFWTLTGQEMASVQDGAKSRLDVIGITYNAELPDLMFTPKYLLR